MCQTKHTGYYGKRFHNSAVCETREKIKTNKEKIKTNTFNNQSSKEEISYYENSVTRKISLKTEKGNKST